MLPGNPMYKRIEGAFGFKVAIGDLNLSEKDRKKKLIQCLMKSLLLILCGSAILFEKGQDFSFRI